jgi:precorrin-2/cobalt-factor-2 C20-methyltransferase
MTGTVYCVGVGPGDPELLTLKAARLIRESGTVLVPGKTAQDSLAYRIAVQAVPELAEKTLLAVEMPMVSDPETLRAAHRAGAARIETLLDGGEDLVFLTLGDPTVYCTFRYLQHLLEADGYRCVLVSGVPSFCAAAARLNVSLTEWDEALHVIPGFQQAARELPPDGSYVIMKAARRMPEIKELLRRNGLEACCVENCGMETERVYRCLDDIPDDAGYFSLILAKRPQKR